MCYHVQVKAKLPPHVEKFRYFSVIIINVVRMDWLMSDGKMH